MCEDVEDNDHSDDGDDADDDGDDDNDNDSDEPDDDNDCMMMETTVRGDDNGDGDVKDYGEVSWTLAAESSCICVCHCLVTRDAHHTDCRHTKL